ncbi:hypothetical protein GCM10008915_20180 [Bifidobacterium pullorum subsp. gallinarum]
MIELQYLFDVHPDHPHVRQLCMADPLLGELVQRIGHIQVPYEPDGFTYITRTLIGQQLSIKAARTIFLRVEQVCGTITADAILAAAEDSLRSAGLSRNKLGYIRNAAEQTKLGALHFPSLADLDDDEVVRQLTLVKGIGRWTAEMFLIFHLGRQDVLSFGDHGLKRASEWLYAAEANEGRSPLHRKQAEWKPYSTIASLYLWEAINAGLVQSGPFLTQFKNTP